MRTVAMREESPLALGCAVTVHGDTTNNATANHLHVVAIAENGRMDNQEA
jgi:hypothetical protein